MDTIEKIEKGEKFVKIVVGIIKQMGLGKAKPTPGSGSGKKKGDVLDNLDFLIECKNEASPNWKKNIDQSREQARIGNYHPEKWLLLQRDPKSPDDNPDIIAAMDGIELFKLLKKNQEPVFKAEDRENKRDIESLLLNLKKTLKIIEDPDELTGGDRWVLKNTIESAKVVLKMFDNK